MWAFIRTIHRAAHLTIAVSPKSADDLIAAGACNPKTVKVCGFGIGDRVSMFHACTHDQEHTRMARAHGSKSTASVSGVCYGLYVP
jgi:hypothetical protein